MSEQEKAQAADEAPITLTQMIKCVEREIALRKSVYAKRVQAKEMKPEDARHELDCMVAILEALTKLRGAAILQEKQMRVAEWLHNIPR